MGNRSKNTVGTAPECFDPKEVDVASDPEGPCPRGGFSAAGFGRLRGGWLERALRGPTRGRRLIPRSSPAGPTPSGGKSNAFPGTSSRGVKRTFVGDSLRSSRCAKRLRDLSSTETPPGCPPARDDANHSPELQATGENDSLAAVVRVLSNERGYPARSPGVNTVSPVYREKCALLKVRMPSTFA